MTDAAGDPDSVPKDSLSLLDELANAPCEPAPEGTTTLQMHAFLAVAMAKHREGRLAEAEQMYRQVLRWQPDQPDAYHLLGLLAAQVNRPDDALPLFERAIALNPTVPEYHANYGNALTIAARIDDAEAAFAKAISLRPDFPEALMTWPRCGATAATWTRRSGCYTARSRCGQTGRTRSSTSPTWPWRGDASRKRPRCSRARSKPRPITSTPTRISRAPPAGPGGSTRQRLPSGGSSPMSPKMPLHVTYWLRALPIRITRKRRRLTFAACSITMLPISTTLSPISNIGHLS
jgi:tetratricopeptide (TPR) repeat protein